MPLSAYATGGMEGAGSPNMCTGGEGYHASCVPMFLSYGVLFNL